METKEGSAHGFERYRVMGLQPKIPKKQSEGVVVQVQTADGGRTQPWGGSEGNPRVAHRAEAPERGTSAVYDGSNEHPTTGRKEVIPRVPERREQHQHERSIGAQGK